MTHAPALAGMALALIALPALADPCKAIPDRGPTPAHLRPGSTFSGFVVYVGDGDSLCVAVPPPADPRGWVEVRLADFYAPELSEAGGLEARATLITMADGARVTCKAGRRTYDRIAAVCTLGGVSLGKLLRAAGVREGGQGYRPR